MRCSPSFFLLLSLTKTFTLGAHSRDINSFMENCRDGSSNTKVIFYVGNVSIHNTCLCYVLTLSCTNPGISSPSAIIFLIVLGCVFFFICFSEITMPSAFLYSGIPTNILSAGGFLSFHECWYRLRFKKKIFCKFKDFRERGL